MQHKPVISIVTPVLNGAAYIRCLIASLKAQSFQSWEHIIIDGGSSDGTIDAVTSAYSDDQRLVLVEKPGAGIYASVITGLQIARGEILGWQNADDVYTPWALAAVEAFQKRTSASWLTGLPGCWDSDETLRFVRPYGWYPRALIRRGWFHAELLGFIQQESIFFTKGAFESLLDFERNSVADAVLAGDFLLWKRLARSQRLEVLPTVVSGFRRHRENRSHKKFEQYMREVRSDGAVFLPRGIAAICRNLFRVMSSRAALKQVDIEDRILNREIQLDIGSHHMRPDELT
ncbi:MAG: glycosyltransferase [Pseudomonadota bacterium]